MDLKKQSEKNRVIIIQKEKRPGCFFFFWITMTLLFAPCLFQVRILDPKNISGRPDKLSRCRLTGRVCYLWCPSFVLPRQIYCSTIVSPSLPLGWKCTNLISAKLKCCCLCFCYPLCSCVQQGRRNVWGWDEGTCLLQFVVVALEGDFINNIAYNLSSNARYWLGNQLFVKKR